MKALIVDDDLALADVVSFTLRRAGYEVILAHDGQAALDRWQQDQPDFLILDLNLPKLSGLEVCKHIRAEMDTPILILSVRDEDDDVVGLLDAGADDYIVKPFSPRQLLARVEKVLRRTGTAHPVSDRFTAGDLALDGSRGDLNASDKPVMHLTPLENHLLQTLMINKGQVLPADALIDHVWGPGGADRAMLKQLVYRLRAKVKKLTDTARIETVAGIGYCLAVSREKENGSPG
jgi:DNA-binding response OmpR family regulator